MIICGAIRRRRANTRRSNNASHQHRLDREAYTAAKRPFSNRITELALQSAGGSGPMSAQYLANLRLQPAAGASLSRRG
jgi:hypothetical protein